MYYTCAPYFILETVDEAFINLVVYFHLQQPCLGQKWCKKYSRKQPNEWRKVIMFSLSCRRESYWALVAVPTEQA